MKKLFLFIALTFAISLTSNSFAQNILTIFDASDPMSCDGAAAIDSNVVVSNTIWYGGGVVLQTGGTWIDNLCPGTYILTYDDSFGNPISYTFVITGNGDPCAGFYSTVSTTDVTDSVNCNGTAMVNVYGGTAPYTYTWNNGVTTISQSNLCEGLYACYVTDANGCTSTYNGYVGGFPIIPDSVLIVVNTTYPDSLVIDSLANYWLAMCNLDYAAFDSAYISYYSYPNLDTVWISWTLIDTLGAEMAVVVVPYVVNNPSGGVYAATLSLFCVQKASEINTIQITDQILLDPAQMGILENSGIALNIINPFDSELSISFKEPMTGNVSLTDINGRILIETVFNNESEIQLNTMNVSSGTYFLTFESNGKIITRKLIK
jgi:hypothetical protein